MELILLGNNVFYEKEPNNKSPGSDRAQVFGGKMIPNPA